jgi:threonine synthase
MQMLSQAGRFHLTEEQAGQLRREFAAGAAGEDEVAATIRDTRERSGYLLDPHTACGVYAARNALKGRVSEDTARVVLATAHPAKFPDAMEHIMGERPALPRRLASLMTDPERYPVLGNELKEVQTFVAQVSRAAGAPV